MQALEEKPASGPRQDVLKEELNVETDARFTERDTDRTIRHRNKLPYRINHWPI